MLDRTPPAALTTPIRIGFCGEVSSGKSTVLQSIMQESFLPDCLAITQRPLVRVLLGADAPSIEVVHADGSETRVATLAEVSAMDDIAQLKIARPEDFGLDFCELIEFPAFRDGHIEPAIAETMEDVDVLVWMTIGSQAWRLSEKNILDDLMPYLPQSRFLVATRADKFRTLEDRQKLQDRLVRETTDYFGKVHMLGVSQDCFAPKGRQSKWAIAGVDGLLADLTQIVTTKRTGAKPVAATTPEPSEFEGETELRPSARPKYLRRSRTTTWSSPRADVFEDAVEPADVEQPAPQQQEDIARARETVENLTQKVAAVTAPSPVEDLPQNPMTEFITSLHGIVAFGSVSMTQPDDIERIYGADEKVNEFASFCALAAKTMLDIAGFGGTDPHPESEQVVMTNHNIIYRLKNDSVLFLVGESAMLSTGIARTAFQRLVHLHDSHVSESV